MIELSPALQAHVAQNVTSLAYCWTIARTDGLILGFTDHDEPIMLGGIIHDPQTGLNATASELELGMAVASMEVEGALRSDKINAQDLRNGRYNDAEVTTTLVNWCDPTQNVVLKKAKVARVTISGNMFRAELQNLTAALDKRIGRLVRRNCDAELGDQRCRKLVNTAAYQTTGTVVTVHAAGDFTVSGLSGFNAGWFEGGRIEWLSGSNSGTSAIVESQENSAGAVRILLLLAPSGAIAVGDGFRLTAGCDKSFATCKQKFSNHLNFQGFPHLPGNDAVYAYVDGSSIFDGAPLVP